MAEEAGGKMTTRNVDIKMAHGLLRRHGLRVKDMVLTARIGDMAMRKAALSGGRLVRLSRRYRPVEYYLQEITP